MYLVVDIVRAKTAYNHLHKVAWDSDTSKVVFGVLGRTLWSLSERQRDRETERQRQRWIEILCIEE